MLIPMYILFLCVDNVNSELMTKQIKIKKNKQSTDDNRKIIKNKIYQPHKVLNAVIYFSK